MGDWGYVEQLKEIVDLIQKKADKENRPAGDILDDLIKSLKEAI